MGIKVIKAIKDMKRDCVIFPLSFNIFLERISTKVRL